MRIISRAAFFCLVLHVSFGSTCSGPGTNNMTCQLATEAKHLEFENVPIIKYAVIQQYRWAEEWSSGGEIGDMIKTANWWFQNARFDESIQTLKDACEKFPDHPLLLFLLGTTLLLANDANTAISALEQSIDIYNKFPDAHNNLGVACELSGDLSCAFESYSSGVFLKDRLSGSNGKLFINLARLLEKEGKKEEAISAYRNGTEVFYLDTSDYWFANGMAEHLSGNVSGAHFSFFKSVENSENAYPVPSGVFSKTDLDELRQKRFSVIYERKFWGGPYASGPGSSPLNTAKLREQLPALIRELSVSSILDVGCGDWTWIPLTNLSGIHYTGVDIVPKLIQDNKKKAEDYLSSKNPLAPISAQFFVVDIAKDDFPLPPRDLIFCREVIIHLPVADIYAFLKKVSDSGSKYLILDSDENVEINNDTSNTFFTLPGSGWRTVNLFKFPFNLPTPIVKLDRGAALWSLPFPDY